MHISVKCYATLAPYQPHDNDRYPVTDGETLESLLKRLGLQVKDVKLFFVNGKNATLDTLLQDGDRVALFPPVGGG